jgi:DNA-3-methyladenine glycosylase II
VGSFEIRPVGPYSLASSVRFLEGFAPASYEGDGLDRLRLAFIADGVAGGSEAVAGVCVYPEGDTVMGEVYGGADAGVVRRQVERILSLDVDGSDYPKVGARDPVVERLRARYPGLRPVLFYSPHEAAAWAIIGQRIRIAQAAKIKSRMAEELGTAVEIRGEPTHAFPGPSRLLELKEFPGLTGVKVERLNCLAAAALEGKLDAGYLRSLPVEGALEELERLPGIGPFSAELILLRGAGEPDHLPEHEPRLARAVAKAYGLEGPPTTGELRRLVERWRPYRTWVSLCLRAMLEEETREISGSVGR